MWYVYVCVCVGVCVDAPCMNEHNNEHTDGRWKTPTPYWLLGGCPFVDGLVAQLVASGEAEAHRRWFLLPPPRNR